MDQEPISRQFREIAAANLRAARRATSDEERQEKVMVAMGYKAIAATEEWLEGLPNKSAFGFRRSAEVPLEVRRAK